MKKEVTKLGIKPGYKKTPVGIIPEDWKVKKIKNLSNRIGDGIHSTPKYTNNEKYFFINGNNLKNGNIIIDENTKTVTEEESLKHKRELNNRTILMSINGTIGNLAFYKNEKVILGKSACYLNIIEKVDLNYIYFQLSSNYIQTKFYKRLTGSTIKNLGLNEIRKTELPIPPLSEQKSIAACLSTWDKGIYKLTQLIQAKKQQKKGLMQQLLTGKKRLIGFDRKWEEKKLGEIAKVYQPQTISQNDLTETGYNVYGANGIIGFYTKYNHETAQIAVVCRGSTCGLVNFTKPKSWITGNAMVINIDENPEINKRFLYEYLDLDNLNYLITGSGQPQITSDIKKHIIKLPQLREQTAIAEILQTAYKEIELLEQKLAAFQEQKKGLMQVLLTGERRLI